MNSKTIILSNEQNTSSRGIVTLYIEDELLKVKLRLYNTPKLNAYAKLGIYHNEEVYKANLLEKYGSYESSFVGTFDLSKDFYLAIIDTNSNNVILSGGTYSGYFFTNTELFNTNQEQENENLDCKIEQCSFENEKCKTCKYKQFFYENNVYVNTDGELEDDSTIKPNTIQTSSQTQLENDNQQNLNNQEINTNQQQENYENPNFLNQIIPQFKYIFENYPLDEELNSLLENAKFVKISENNQQYSIGTISENDTIKYICYAVKSNYNSPAPEELGQFYQWLPTDKDDPLSEGYYIVFQDAIDLKIVQT